MESSEMNGLDVLHQIITIYEQDSFQFYTRCDRVNTKFSGRFNFAFFARKIFDPIATDKVGQLYLDLFENSEPYMHQTKKSYLMVQGFPISKISIPELLMNMILAYQLPRQTHDSESSTTTTTSNSRRRPSHKKTTMPRVTLTRQQSKILVEHMLKIPLGPESNLWKQVKYVLNPGGNHQTHSDIMEGVRKSAEDGMISYAALVFFMRDEKIRQVFKNPATILHALYLGPLDATTVEGFASNRSDAFRQECQNCLRIALAACYSKEMFSNHLPVHIQPGHRDLVPFHIFQQNVHNLKAALVGTSSNYYPIPVSWAMAALKKFGHKRYVENTWNDEQLYDLIWTILAQRPHMKKHICETLDNKFQDRQAAAFWRRMQPQQMSKTHIRNYRENEVSSTFQSETYLNFLPEMSWPPNFVTLDTDIHQLIRTLKKRVQKYGRITVGVDAEWSAYTFPSKATILQIGLRDTVYVLDLDSRNIAHDSYAEFMQTLFDDPNIVKVGFNFGEDLHQLRGKFRLCKSLYNAKKVICIGKMVSKLVDDVEMLDNAAEVKKEILPFLIEEKVDLDDSSLSAADRSMDSSKLEESMLIDENEPEMSPNSPAAQAQSQNPTTDRRPKKILPITKPSIFVNKGLSFICEKILGKPLDKTEQCSVWDRRPLRNLQLRYAALDAHCMLMLYDKCEQLFAHLKIDINQYIDSQSAIKVSLPLLTEYPL
ncbi:unnamed protein product [Caenorhabditis angaria]|uniref:3'-5' exonuclease domain-containing protein n=1 Tax=Caenorhabditis angaria TaxID=860376 RepID=A0A9P1IAE1_9PELO|nr:unnamed protein product [Caenorhabditis angaria]